MNFRTDVDLTAPAFDFDAPISDELAETIAFYGDQAMREHLAMSPSLTTAPAIALLDLHDTAITALLLSNPALTRRARAHAEKMGKPFRAASRYMRRSEAAHAA